MSVHSVVSSSTIPSLSTSEEKSGALPQDCLLLSPPAPPLASPLPALAFPPSEEEEKDVILEFSFGRYTGQVHPENASLRHGKGRLVYCNGNIYTGEWKNGAPDGFGEKKYLNGDSFVGFWVNGKREGNGSYLFRDGDMFAGMYVQDQPEGYGTLNTEEGDRYAGGWKGGYKHGVGVELLHTGEEFTGTWKKGKKHGLGALRLPGVAEVVHGVWEHDVWLRDMTKEEEEQWIHSVGHPGWWREKRGKEWMGRGSQVPPRFSSPTQSTNSHAKKGVGAASSLKSSIGKTSVSHVEQTAKEKEAEAEEKSTCTNAKTKMEEIKERSRSRGRGVVRKNCSAASMASVQDLGSSKERDGNTFPYARPPLTTPTPQYVPGERENDGDDEFEWNSSDEERDGLIRDGRQDKGRNGGRDVVERNHNEKLEGEEEGEDEGRRDIEVIKDGFTTASGAKEEGGPRENLTLLPPNRVSCTSLAPTFTTALCSGSPSSFFASPSCVAPGIGGIVNMQELSSLPDATFGVLAQSIWSMEARLNVLEAQLANALKNDA